MLGSRRPQIDPVFGPEHVHMLHETMRSLGRPTTDFFDGDRASSKRGQVTPKDLPGEDFGPDLSRTFPPSWYTLGLLWNETSLRFQRFFRWVLCF
jgi:hypothetical protein